MERNFTDENFERFLRQSADGLRMRPSDKVWSNISGRLNRKRRRFGFLLGASLLLTSGLGYYLTEYSGSHQDTALSHKNAATTTNAPTGITTTPSGPVAMLPADRSPDQKINVLNSGNSAVIQSTKASTGNLAPGNKISVIKEVPFNSPVIDSHMGMQAESTLKTETATPETAQPPLTIESITNSYTGRGHKHRVGLQVYFTPTVSYRKLSDTHIDNVVTHKPDFGFELGLAAKYRVSRNVRIRGGLQFNVNRYDIRTYNTTTQLATIRLNNRSGRDSFNIATNYNNDGGYSTDWLENYYFQVSAPVGVEVKLRGDERMQFGVAATMQPTYILGDRAYLISSDYRNYAEVPKLIRRWNLNTSFEPYVAYSTGHLKWQVGPQVRYQLLSSYVKKYPVKENLFDFGLKVGIALNNQ